MRWSSLPSPELDAKLFPRALRLLALRGNLAFRSAGRRKEAGGGSSRSSTRVFRGLLGAVGNFRQVFLRGSCRWKFRPESRTIDSNRGRRNRLPCIWKPPP